MQKWRSQVAVVVRRPAPFPGLPHAPVPTLAPILAPARALSPAPDLVPGPSPVPLSPAVEALGVEAPLPPGKGRFFI